MQRSREPLEQGKDIPAGMHDYLRAERVCGLSEAAVGVTEEFLQHSGTEHRPRLVSEVVGVDHRRHARVSEGLDEHAVQVLVELDHSTDKAFVFASGDHEALEPHRLPDVLEDAVSDEPEDEEPRAVILYYSREQLYDREVKIMVSAYLPRRKSDLPV